MYKVSFIIPVHNRLEYNKECLQILEKQKNTSFFKKNNVSIIIVDDGSTDGTKEWIKENYSDVIILYGDGNLWYSGSLNLGIEYSLNTLQCDFIHVWENDIIPIGNYFENLQTIIENWDGKTLISSKLYYKSHPEMILSMGGSFNPKTGKATLNYKNEFDKPEYNHDLEVDWFSGQQALIHKDIIKTAGLFDNKNFPQYHADIDYSLRVRKFNFKIIVYGNLKLLNDTESTGMSHLKNKTLKQFLQSLFTLRSNTNIIKDIKFYRRHTSNLMAYKYLIKKYFIYTGSYLKWSILGFFGIKRKKEGLF